MQIGSRPSPRSEALDLVPRRRQEVRRRRRRRPWCDRLDLVLDRRVERIGGLNALGALGRVDDRLGERRRARRRLARTPRSARLRARRARARACARARSSSSVSPGKRLTATTGFEPELLDDSEVAREVRRATLDRRVPPSGSPPCCSSALTVATSTTALGRRPPDPADDVEELLHPHVRAEARLGDDVVGELERRRGRRRASCCRARCSRTGRSGRARAGPRASARGSA